jgi:hypothetical protein
VAAAGPQEDQAFVRALHVDVLGREPTAEELAACLEVLGPTTSLCAQWVINGPENEAHEITELYRQALGRDPDPDGFAFWSTSGLPVPSMTASVYGSQEYVERHGPTPSSWVDGIFSDLLGRAPDPGSRAFWADVAASKGYRFAARRVYESPEHSQQRVTDVFEQMLRRPPEPQGLRYWLGQLRGNRDDQWLMMIVSLSTEYAARALARFP